MTTSFDMSEEEKDEAGDLKPEDVEEEAGGLRLET
jgi:hypothetical protein